MQNAKDMTDEDAVPRFLMAGPMGTGKTELFSTLPGKKFMYVFDPNAMLTLKGHDIEYEEFLADVTDVDFAAKTLKKDGPRDKASTKVEPKTYMDWEADFVDRTESNWFKDNGIRWIGMDSFTSFAQCAMDRILFLNHRTGMQPQQDDWAAQINIITSVFRVLAAQKLGVYCTAHLDVKQHDLTKRISHQLVMTGQMRTRIPLLFSNVFICHADDVDGQTKYEVQTRPDKDYETVRCGLKGLDKYEDVTIPSKVSNPEDYGLGALLKKAGVSLQVETKGKKK